MPEDEPKRAELLLDVLGWQQINLYELGRRAEGLAVRAEMAEVSRSVVALSDHRSVSGLRTLAHGLAEEGRHGEAADLLAEVVDRTLGADVYSTPIWDRLSLTAALDAAGRTDAALTTIGGILTDERADLPVDRTSMSDVFHTLHWYAVLLDRAARPHDAASARQEALELARRLATGGEAKNWGSSQYTTAGIILAAQARDAEPTVPGQPQPAFGVDMAYWSRDLRARYIEEAGADWSGDTAADRPGTLSQLARQETRLPELSSLQRRLAIRTGTYWLWRRGYRFLEPALPAFDDSVTAARRRHDQDGPPGRPALGAALADRAMLLVAGHRYADALGDYERALLLLDPA